MNKLLLTCAALVMLTGPAMQANAASRHATRDQQTFVQPQWNTSGARVEGVEPASAAERAGLRPGDVIVGINGAPIHRHSDVDPFVAQSGGRPLSLEVNRGGKLLRLRATPHLTTEAGPFGSTRQRYILGYSYTKWFSHGGSDYIEPPPPPPPPAPDPPFVPPPPQPN